MPEKLVVPSLLEYTSIHVTYFATLLKLNPEAFNVSDDDSLPDDIMTIPPETSESTSATTTLDFFRLTKTPLPVNSASTEDHTPAFNLYRLLTPEPPTADQLLSLLRKPQDSTTDNILWSHTKYWPFAWPKASGQTSLDYSRVADNVYTTANTEVIGSSLEIAVTMGLNVAGIVDRDLRAQIQATNCRGSTLELDE